MGGRENDLASAGKSDAARVRIQSLSGTRHYFSVKSDGTAREHCWDVRRSDGSSKLVFFVNWDMTKPGSKPLSPRELIGIMKAMSKRE
jgi:hypothetical protein